MKAIIVKEEFEKKLTEVSKVSYKEAPSVVHLKFTANGLILFSSDGINAIKTNLALKDSSLESDLYINARKVIGFLKCLSCEEIEVSINDAFLKVQGEVEASFQLEFPETFPGIPEIDMSHGVVFSVSNGSGGFTEALNACLISADNNSPVLSYVNVEYNAEKLELFSSDGIRATLKRLPISNLTDVISKERPSDILSFNIPINVVGMLTESNEDIQCFVNDKYIHIMLGELVIFSKKSAIVYPDVKKIIVSNFSFKENCPFNMVWEVERDVFRKKLEILKTILADEVDKKIKINFGKKVISTHKSRDLCQLDMDGSINGVTDIKPVGLDLRKVILTKSKNLRICFFDEGKPIYVFNSGEESEFSELTMIMPCMLE